MVQFQALLTSALYKSGWLPSRPLYYGEKSPGGYWLKGFPEWVCTETNLYLFRESNHSRPFCNLVTKPTKLFRFHTVYAKLRMTFTRRYRQFKTILHNNTILSKEEGPRFIVDRDIFLNIVSRPAVVGIRPSDHSVRAVLTCTTCKAADHRLPCTTQV